MERITFLNPEFFWLLLLLPLAVIWYIYTRNKQTATLTISNTNAFNQTDILAKIKPILFILRLLALSFIIIALARPRTVDVSAKTLTTKGIDIVMAIDVSSSMLANDLKPNRLEALKRVASEFVSKRYNDRIGLVVYAGESYTLTPVTSDKAIVLQALKTIAYDDSVMQDGTAIGVGLATSINRIKNSKAKSRVIILLTDGVNNSGTVDPKTAAEIAKKYGIKVYTIGLGTNGQALFPVAKDDRGNLVFRKMPVEIDEKLMKEVANVTQGKYYRANSNEKLKEIYNDINKLETTEIQEKKYFNYDEKYRTFLWFAFGFIVLEFLLKNTIYRGLA